MNRHAMLAASLFAMGVAPSASVEPDALDYDPPTPEPFDPLADLDSPYVVEDPFSEPLWTGRAARGSAVSALRGDRRDAAAAKAARKAERNRTAFRTPGHPLQHHLGTAWRVTYDPSFAIWTVRHRGGLSARFSDMDGIVLDEPWHLCADALRAAVAEGLTGEVVIEVTRADETCRAVPWPPVSP